MNDKPLCCARNVEATIKSQPFENHSLQTSFAVSSAQAISSHGMAVPRFHDTGHSALSN